jgi:exosortase
MRERAPNRARAVLVFAAFGTLWFILCRHLSGEWSLNEQYSYGWFVPLFCAYLFWLRWEDRPDPEVPPSPSSGVAGRSQKSEVKRRTLVAIAIAIPALVLLFPLRLLEIANPDWRPLSWLHAISVVTLTLVLLWWIGGKGWLRHFAFPVAFFLLAIPWPTGLEAPVIQGLMRVVATVATEVVRLMGIPAQLEGNLIRVSSGIVGISEACSGVRSLQTSLMIGLLFGELKRLSILRRGFLVVVAASIALAANFFRTVFLVWIAGRKDVSAVGHWHDFAGYFIVALVFLGSMAAAALLQKKVESRKAKVEVRSQPPSPGYGEPGRSEVRGRVTSFFPHPSSFILLLLWLLLIEFASAAWYREHERGLVASTRWQVQWPENAPHFREVKIDEDARRILRFDQGHAASWMVTESSRQPFESDPVICAMYFFRWNPGRNSALLANFHRPDVCLPAVGWKQVADTGVRDYPVRPPFTLPFRHFEFQRGGQSRAVPQVAHAFYCLWEDRAAAPSAGASKLPQMTGARSSWTRQERLRAVWEGRRHLGQQVMEVVLLARHPIDGGAAEEEFAKLLPNLIISTENKEIAARSN